MRTIILVMQRTVLFLPLLLLSGCLMTKTVENHSTRAQTFELQKAGMSKKQILLSYEVKRSGDDHYARCAAWDKDSLESRKRNEVVLSGNPTNATAMSRKGVEPIPLISQSKDAAALLKNHSAVIILKEPAGNEAELQLLSTGGTTNHYILITPDKDTYITTGGSLLMPFTFVTDIAAFPLELAASPFLILTGNWPYEISF